MSIRKKYRPPTVFEWIMQKMFPDKGEYSTVGDLNEQFAYITENTGFRKAKWWYRKEVMKSLIPLFKNTFFSGGFMFKNYFKIGIRNLIRDKTYSFINLFGLVVGLTTFVLIMLYVRNEYSYDKFNTKYNNIYRLNRIFTPISGDGSTMAITSGPMGPELVRKFPEIKTATRVLPWFQDVVFEVNDNSLKISDVVITDPDFFNVFDYKLIKGDPVTALTDPNAIILSEEIASRLFGAEDAMGKIIKDTDGDAYTVTGIIENTPTNSHLVYNVLLPWPINENAGMGWLHKWRPQTTFTFLVLDENADVATLNDKIDSIIAEHLPSKVGQYNLYLQPLSEVYLNSSDILYTLNTKQGNESYNMILLIAAILILVIASFNYMNLSSARAIKRAGEISVRKTLGATKNQIVIQFLSESFVLTISAAVVSIVLILGVLQIFDSFIGKKIDSSITELSLFLLGICFITTFITGSYPALLLSKLKTTTILRGSIAIGKSSATPRRVLVGIQFVVSIFLISSTILINKQMNFIFNKDLGYKAEQILVLPASETKIRSKYDAFKTDVLSNPNVVSAAYLNSMPGTTLSSFGIDFDGKPQNEDWLANAIRVGDFNLLETMEIELVSGRYFSEKFPTDSTNAVVINETLARDIGWTNPVGKRLDIGGEVDHGTVIGVVKDFHMKSLHHPVDPIVIHYTKRGQNLAVKLKPHNLQATLNYLEKTWQRYDSKYPFEYYFLDEKFEELYSSETQTMSIFSTFSGLAVFVASLGLLGLISYSVERRTKEIGIRKVLGAKSSNIAYLVSKEFLYIIITASVISIPITFIVMKKWLQDFAYRTSIDMWIFIAAGGAVLLISFLVLSIQAYRAAQTDPAKTLKVE